MATSKKTYRDLKAELEEVLAWFESGDVDVDEALEKHAKAKKLLAELESYLQSAEQKLTKIT